MKKAILLLALVLATTAVYSSFPDRLIVTTDADIVREITEKDTTFKNLGTYSKTGILQTSEENLHKIAKLTHAKGVCGGFFVHDSLDEAKEAITNLQALRDERTYRVQDSSVVKALINDVKESKVREMIEKLSALNNRYYQSDTGVEGSNIIKERWSTYAPTELYAHKKWKQPSVIATITGSKYPEKVIVLGGHLDSIAGFFGGNTAKAPGADDNASGIASITEALRILSEAKYRPLHTIQFMGYAAEEVGLRGSDEIAADYKRRGVGVVGAMQLDMTNFKGSPETIFLTEDYTDKSQTNFLAKLIETYVKVPYSRTTCGYACSDHASWTKAGYPAVFPFESDAGAMNKKIHTAGDTLAVSGGNAQHATNFTKLALAYIIEMDLQGVNVSL